MALFLLVTLLAGHCFAGVDMTVFGPKRYDRYKGSPNVYTDTFDRCEPSAVALLRVNNGNGKDTSITSGQITVNGIVVISEDDFKQQKFLIEKPIPVLQHNELKVELKSSSRERSFVIVEIVGRNCDSTAPVIFAPTPADGALLNISRPEVSASYRDEANGSGIDPRSAKLTLDGADVTADAVVTATGISYIPASDLPLGAHVAVLSIGDRAANSSSLVWRFTTDTVPPKFEITSPASGSYLNTPSISISGKINDPTARVTLNGVAAQVDGDTFTLEGFTLSEGSNSISGKAVDPAGNSATSAITVVLDTKLPEVKIDSPSGVEFVNTPTIVVSGTVDDVSTKVKVNGIPAEVAGLNFKLEEFALSEGDNGITVEAEDRAGNKRPVTVAINLDTVVPKISVASPVSEWVNTPLIPVSGKVTEAHLEGFWINDAPTPVESENFSVNAFPLQEGHNEIKMLALDKAGNELTILVPVNLDTATPRVSIDLPEHGFLTNTAEMTVSGKVSEEFTAVTVNGIPATVTGTDYTLVYTLAEGVNTLTVRATDRAGNVGTATVTGTLDTVAPAAPRLNLLRTPTNVATVTISGSAEAGSTVKIVSAAGTAVGSLSADAQGNFALAEVVLAEGENSFTATATDAATNRSEVSEPVSALLDTVLPVVRITSHRDGDYLNTPTVAVSGTLEDPSAEVTVNGQPAAKTAGGFTLAGLTLTEGDNTLTVRATDPATNVGTDSITVHLDTAAPVLTVSAPLANAFLKAPMITVAGGTNEPVTEVTVNGAAATLTGEGFTLPITLVEGENSLSVRAKDRAGNEGSLIVPVNLDTVAPGVTINAPEHGLLTKNRLLTVSGTVTEDFTNVTVNNGPAEVTGKNFTAAYTLTEGMNSINVAATDRAGNSGNSTVRVTLDSTPPDPPVLDPIHTPTNVTTLLISGKAEANATVRIFLAGALTGTVMADAQGSFALENVPLSEGENGISATVVDTAGNESASATAKVTLDTVSPVLSVTSPVEESFVSTAQIVVSGSSNEPLQALVLNGEPVTLNGTEFRQQVTLVPGGNTVTLVATDLAGNQATKSVATTLDPTPPSVSISAPVSGLSTNQSQVTVTGTISEENTTATINGTSVTVTGQAFSFIYTLQEGDNTLTVEATDRAGNKGSASVTRTLDTQLPVLSLQAPAEAAAGANIAVTVDASDNVLLNLVELKVDGMPVWSGGNSASVSDPVSYRLSPTLSAGREIVFEARGVDHVGNQGVATARLKISQGANGPGYVQGKVLDDQRGLLLAGAQVNITDSKGASTVLTTAEDGGYFAEVAAGSTLVRVDKTGYTTVERTVAVLPEMKTTALDARLTPVSGRVNLLDSAGAQVKIPLGTATPLAAELVVPAGVLGVQADLRLTPLGNQGLAAALPAGWSPIAAADLRLFDAAAGTEIETPPQFPATLKFPAPAAASLGAGSVVVLAAYDAGSHQWIAKGNAVPAADGSTVTAAVPGVGEYALLVADPAPNAPPSAEPGKALAPAALPALNFDLTRAAGKVLPQASPPAAGLKAAGEVVLIAIAGADPAPQFASGLVLGGRVTERFDLRAGNRLETPVYTQDLVLYRAACVTNIGQGALTDAPAESLRATFPISPSRDFTIVDLLLGKVGIEILRPDAAAEGGGVMVGDDGARILDADGNVLVIPAGALSQTVPVLTRNGKAAEGVPGSDLTLLKTVELNLTRQTLASSATLSIPLPEGLDPALPLLVAKAIEINGVTRLKLVALAKSSGSFISTDTGAAGIALAGITTSGTYYFLQGKVPFGFLSGTVTGSSGTPFRGALVKTETGSLIDLSASSGSYLLAAPAGSFTAAAIDLASNDEGSASGTIAAPNQVVTANLSIQRVVPRVSKVFPADQALNVQPSVQVVVTFSKRMDKNSINSGTFKVAKADGSAVPGVISFNVDGSAATFYPETALQSEAAYRVTVDGGVKDAQGYQIGAPFLSSFTVRKTTPPPMPAAGAITATFPNADGVITVTATQGSAAPDNTVLLINDATGEIVSVTPEADGSFGGEVQGQLGDEIRVVLMDRSGNQTVISYLTYQSPDGKYLVTGKGGKVEGEGGTALSIPEGALVGPTVVKITPVPEAGLPHAVPNGGLFLGAVNLDTGGFNLQKPVEISMPAPAGMPEGAVPFLAQPQVYINSEGQEEQVYVIIDSAKVVNGRLTTACPPFGGVLTFGIFSFIYFDPVSVLGGPVIFSGTTYQDMDGAPGYTAGVDKPVRGAVIRSPGAENFLSYSDANGHYATYGFTVNDVCRSFPTTAIHPITMNRVTVNLLTCDAPYIVNNFNFRLAEKDTVIPDKAPPIINMRMELVPGQSDEHRISSGTAIAGTKVYVPVSILDQAMGTATLKVTYQKDSTSSQLQSIVLSPSPQTTTVLTNQNVKVQQYDYTANFGQDSSQNYFVGNEPGLYTFTVEAKDDQNNRSSKSITLRIVASGSDLGASVDGPPRVDELTPVNGSEDVQITTSVVAVFSEPVDHVSDTSFTLTEKDTGVPVPVSVYTNVEDGRFKAVLTPKRNLDYQKEYLVTLKPTITDIAPNPSDDNQILPLQEFTASFKTMLPHAYDLVGEKFQNARDIDVYTNLATGRSYAYVAADTSGYRVVEVTDPTKPVVVYPSDLTMFSTKVSAYRGVAADQETGIVAMTENIVFPDNNQYGYVRFYDVATHPTDLRNGIVGQERLAEAWTGIPGRVALKGNYAYVATAGAALQVIDIEAAKAHKATGQMSDGSSIAGVFNSTAEGLGSPNDIVVYSDGKAVMTTNPGWLLPLEIMVAGTKADASDVQPVVLTNLTKYKPDGYSFTRVAVAPEYIYEDESGIENTIDLALAGTREGKLVAIDLSDPYNPEALGEAVDESDNPLSTAVMDLSINENQGIAYVTTYNAVQVIDIRNPLKPRLLKTVTQLNDSSDNAIYLGSIPAIIERDGLVYVASQTEGLKVMDMLSPIYLELVGVALPTQTEANYRGALNFLLESLVGSPVLSFNGTEKAYQIWHDVKGDPYMPKLTLQIRGVDNGEPIDLRNLPTRWTVRVDYVVKSKQRQRLGGFDEPPTKGPDGFILSNPNGSGNTWNIDNWNSKFGGGAFVANAEVFYKNKWNKTNAPLKGVIEGEKTTASLRNKMVAYMKEVASVGNPSLETTLGTKDMLWGMACKETYGINHFWKSIYGQPGGYKYPIENSGGDGGIGVMQLTVPEAKYVEAWNWKKNVLGGVEVAWSKISESRESMNKQFKNYPNLRPFGPEQLKLDVITRYNSGRYWLPSRRGWTPNKPVVARGYAAKVLGFIERGYDETKGVCK